MLTKRTLSAIIALAIGLCAAGGASAASPTATTGHPANPIRAVERHATAHGATHDRRTRRQATGAKRKRSAPTRKHRPKPGTGTTTTPAVLTIPVDPATTPEPSTVPSVTTPAPTVPSTTITQSVPTTETVSTTPAEPVPTTPAETVPTTPAVPTTTTTAEPVATTPAETVPTTTTGTVPSTTTTTSPASCTPAAFPSVLHTNGRVITDANGCALAPMKGFSIQIGPWPQSTLNAIAAKGAKFERLVLFWNQLQGSDCSSLSAANASSYVADIDSHLAEAQAAGIYTELDIHLNVGQVPACAVNGTSESTKYAEYGQWITQYLANRYGNPSSSHYTADVVGFGINEPPPPDNTSPQDYNPAVEQIQNTMLTWIRGTDGSGGAAPQWIGFVAYAWANQAPVFDAPGESSHCSSCIPANPKAYASVGNNVILDFHDYFMGCVGSTWTSISGDSNAADCDGRNSTGGDYHDSDGGYNISVGDSSYPSYPAAGESEATASQQLKNYISPYTTFSSQANIPLMIGEFGWNSSVNTTGAADYMNDLQSSWQGAAPVIELEWDYDVTQSHDGWAANPGAGASGSASNGWLPLTNAFFGSS
jgi:hypothetical protein